MHYVADFSQLSLELKLMKIKFKQDRPGKSIGQLFNNITQV